MTDTTDLPRRLRAQANMLLGAIDETPAMLMCDAADAIDAKDERIRVDAAYIEELERMLAYNPTGKARAWPFVVSPRALSVLTR